MKLQKKKFLLLKIIPLTSIPLSSLTVSANSIENKIPIPTLSNAINEFKQISGLKISNRKNEQIFEAKNGDIYVTGHKTGLEILKQGTTTFKPVLSVNNDDVMEIFQAQNDDIYITLLNLGIKVLKKGEDEFKLIPSKINFKWFTTIFEAQNGDIYVTSWNSFIEVLKKGEDEFKPINNFNLAWWIHFFQTKNGDIYAIEKKGLQVLKGGNIAKDSFKQVINLGIKSSYINIFQAQNEDIYITSDIGIEVLKGGDITKKSFVLITSSTIQNSTRKKIFQAKNGDIYVISKQNIQILKNKKKKFELASGLIKQNGDYSRIFESSNGDIYVMSAKGLKVLKNKENEFKMILPWNINANNISHGQFFEDKNGNIYIFNKQGLKVLKKGTNRFVKAPGSKVTKENWGQIFQAKKDDNIYVIGTGGLEILKQGEAEFKPAPGSNAKDNIPRREQYLYTNNPIFEASNGNIYVMNKNGIEVLYKFNFHIKHNSSKDSNDGIISIINFINSNSKIQYSSDNGLTWIDLPNNGRISNLTPKTYKFQWVGKNGETYIDNKKTQSLPEQTINNGTKISIPIDPNFSKINEKFKNANNGTITITNFTNTYSKLQYSSDNGKTWGDVSQTGKMIDLVPKTYKFRWVGKNDEQYVGGINTHIFLKDIIINKKTNTITKKNKIIIITFSAIGGLAILSLGLFFLVKKIRKNQRRKKSNKEKLNNL